MSYEKMSVQELFSVNSKLSAQRDEIKAEQMKIKDILDRKIAEEAAMKKWESLSDAEKSVLSQKIGSAGGIKTGEVVNSPK